MLENKVLVIERISDVVRVETHWGHERQVKVPAEIRAQASAREARRDLVGRGIAISPVASVGAFFFGISRARIPTGRAVSDALSVMCGPRLPLHATKRRRAGSKHISVEPLRILRELGQFEKVVDAKAVPVADPRRIVRQRCT